MCFFFFFFFFQAEDGIRDVAVTGVQTCALPISIRHLAMTGTVTESMISWILTGSAMRATPPAARMSAGTRSRAITATEPASSAMAACSAFVTSITTPPFCILAKPRFRSSVPNRIRVRSRSRGMVFLRAELTVRGYFYLSANPARPGIRMARAAEFPHYHEAPILSIPRERRQGFAYEPERRKVVARDRHAAPSLVGLPGRCGNRWELGARRNEVRLARFLGCAGPRGDRCGRHLHDVAMGAVEDCLPTPGGLRRASRKRLRSLRKRLSESSLSSRA